MISNDTPSQCTLMIQFTRDLVSNALWLRWYMGLAFPTPLEQLLEDSGSLPASKRVSGTQARLRIEGVWVLQSLHHRRLGPILWTFSNGSLRTGKWLALLRTGVHRLNGGSTQMSLLSHNTVTFSGHTPTH